MNILDSFKIAWGNLTHKRMRSWLTLIGIFAGIAAIVALISLGQGLQGAITEQFASLGINTITVTGAGSSYGPPGTNAVGKLGDHDIQLLERIHGVKDVIGRYIRATVATSTQNIEENAFAASIPSGKTVEKIMDLMGLTIEKGRMIENIRDDQNVVLGGSIEFNNRQPQVGEKIEIKGETFRVVGLVKKKGNFMFDNVIFMTEHKMEELFNVKNDYNVIIVSIEDDADMTAVQDEIARKMRRDRGEKVGDEDFELSTPQESLKAFNDILLIVQILLIGIAAISLVVGAIGIANTMYTSVLERRREIGIMKAIGGTNNNILSIFLIESGLLGMVGGFIGLVVGIGISKGVEFGASIVLGKSILKAIVPWWLILGALSIAFILGALSGTLPARQASKLDPVDCLRK